ncbi:Lipoprotein-releasing system ATP-binding protein LolD [hydrothermal vent metagenome]|uniref:Lipoprotein-releasing system ATP-binding protein LolD n=1 Tax=hydrothermal vent metagenome TaxID=652676 RepID=A0A3B0RF00_9ZZZZ
MDNSTNGAVLELRDITRHYTQGTETLKVFDKLSFSINPGQIVGLVGQSGSGKSSLLHIAGLLEKPTSGEVLIAGRNCVDLNDEARTKIRRYAIGFIYQFHHLLPEFTALENVIMPQMIAGVNNKDATARAKSLLEKLGLGQRLEHRPPELSGGEQQRVAICRALANRPLVLLADEPTGNLDPKTAEAVHKEFLHLIEDEGLAAVIATHNLELANNMHRVVRMEDGVLKES